MAELWAATLYGHNLLHGYGSTGQRYGSAMDFGGLIFGVDGKVPDANARLGFAINAGGGASRSRGDFHSSKDKFDFWGVNIYGSWNPGEFNIIGNLGYAGARHELQQDLPASMDMGSRISADVDTNILTAALRAERHFKTEIADVTPHAGVRFTSLQMDRYNIRTAEGSMFHISSETQNVLSFPLGVTLSRDIETASGWVIRPLIDASVVFNTGERKAETVVRVPSINAEDSFKNNIFDRAVFDGTLGLEAQKGDFRLGINYNIQAASHETGHTLEAIMGWKF